MKITCESDDGHWSVTVFTNDDEEVTVLTNGEASLTPLEVRQLVGVLNLAAQECEE